MNNLVSIIMPAHNAARTIAQAIESVVLQTYHQWELLIVDDCSTDNTISVVSRFLEKDKRIKLLHTDKSVGKPYYPRNIGIQSATGRYIAFLDSDDLWMAEKLSVQIPLFESDDVAIVFSYYEKFSAEQISEKKRVIKSPSFVSFKSALYGNPIGNLTGVYDSQKVGKVYYENIGHEDYVLWLTILKKGYMAKNTNTVEACYRVAEKSVSSNKGKAALWTWNIYRRTLGFNFVQSLFCYALYVTKGILKFIK